MGRGASGEQAVAVSGSAVAELRRRALTNDSSSTFLVDAEMRIRATAGNAGLDETGLIGLPLTEAIDAPGEERRIATAFAKARAGGNAETTLAVRDGRRIAMRCAPLEGDLGGGALVHVTLAEQRPAEDELSELRSRARDLETLASAARALARSTYAEEARRTVCEAAVDVAGSEFAALLEVGADGSSLHVAASHGADLEGRSAGLDRATMAARALSTGRPSFSADLGQGSSGSAWPLRGVGAQAAVWQPVRRAIGIRGVIAVGWSRPPGPPSERLMGSLELVAAEAAVAIDRAAALEQLSGMARTDPLTELSNRRAWQDELGRELARAERSSQPLSIGLIDLDELKSYNDSWGHAAGDRVLLTAAARWRRRLRLTDLLARIGGDEFAVTMPGCTLAEAVTLADQLRSALPDGLTCSIGVTEWSVGESPTDLLSRADEALYAAKNQGRDATHSLPPPAGVRMGRSVPSP